MRSDHPGRSRRRAARSGRSWIKALGTGASISKAAARDRIASTTAALPGFSRSVSYGLGSTISEYLTPDHVVKFPL